MAWIKLHSQLLDSEVFASEKGLKIWVWLILKARRFSGFIPIKIGLGQSVVELKRGQLLFGRFTAEEKLGINGSTIYKWLKKFQEMGMINIESNSHSTTITIANYDTYNDKSNSQVTAEEQPSNSQVTAKSPLSPSPSNTKKRDKIDIEREEGKEKEKEIQIPPEPEFLTFCKDVLKEKHQALEFSLKAKYEAWVADGWKDGNGKKIKNWKTKIKNTIPFLKPLYGNKSTEPDRYHNADKPKDYSTNSFAEGIEKIKNQQLHSQ